MLTEAQLTWLRGLSTCNRHIPMSASEMGNPEVSELQSRGLVHIRYNNAGREWMIMDEGKAALSDPGALAPVQRPRE